MGGILALLFALTTAQPYMYTPGAFGARPYGAGPYGPPPLYRGPDLYGPPGYSMGYGAPPPAPAPPSAPSQFAINQQVLAVNAQDDLAIGSQVAFSYPPLTPIESLHKAQGENIDVRASARAIGQYKATHNASTADRKALRDLRLTKQATIDERRRREAELIVSTPALPFPSVFRDAEAKELLKVDHDQLESAEQAYAKDPSQANRIALRDARDNIRVQKDYKTSFGEDLLGVANPVIGTIGPAERTKAAKLTLQVVRRDHQQLVDAYRKNPTAANWWAVRADEFKVKGFKADYDGDKGAELGTFPSLLGGSSSPFVTFYTAKRFADEDVKFRRYQKLQLQALYRQRAAANAGSASSEAASAQSRMMALASYGPAPGVSAAVNVGAYGPAAPFAA